MNRLLAVMIPLLLCAGPVFAEGGFKKTKPRPHEYGAVVIDNFSTPAGIAPVTFDHWLHRANYTCRLCHVDIGFAMTANDTRITAADNMRGYFCGACHDGRRLHEGRAIFAACVTHAGAEEAQRCERCHFAGKNPARERAFAQFAAGLPRERFGNGIDWEKAELEGRIKPRQYLEGVSAERAAMAVQQDFALEAKTEGMPDIIFSHQKHTVWNGCELCHPDLFLGIRKGATKYSMIELFQGRYCGVCHDRVAFPQTDCQRCHAKPVQ